MTVIPLTAVAVTELEMNSRFRMIREGLKGARVRIRSGEYKGRLGRITRAVTSPEALIEALIVLDEHDQPYRPKPRLRLGITKFEVI